VLVRAVSAFFLELSSQTRDSIFHVSTDSTLYFPQGLKARLRNKLDEFNVSIRERETFSSVITWTTRKFYEANGSKEEKPT
jgi:fatty acid-binding protein DegV